MDTIFAQATAHGKSGVSIVRVSGPGARDACEAIAGFSPTARTSRLRKLRDAEGRLIDTALVLYFEARASFTGEDVTEFQCHGSVAIVASLLQTLSARPGFRLAEPGEFSRRALENGQLDLSQIEGLSDLIEAETEGQRRQAIRVFEGALGDCVKAWRDKLIRAAALLEATIDFADEDVPVDVTPEVDQLIRAVVNELAAELDGADAAERIRDGFEVAIVGPPNAGKSTLLNALAGRDAAITSEVAGTTRDVIEVRMDLSGLPVTVLDTAGLRDTEDKVERIGVDRAVSRAKDADLRVFLLDQTGADLLVEPSLDDIVVQGKADLEPGGDVSGETGQGVAQLIDDITSRLKHRSSNASVVIRERHRIGLQNALGALNHAREALDAPSVVEELVAEEIRSAARFLEAMIGKVDVEDLLDEIFATFCLGK